MKKLHIDLTKNSIMQLSNQYSPPNSKVTLKKGSYVVGNDEGDFFIGNRVFEPLNQTYKIPKEVLSNVETSWGILP